MKILHIAVVDKIATYQRRDGGIVCGNSDYVIEFAFDSEWDKHTDKVARFIIGNHYENVSFSGNTCPIPIITNATSISVGVYAGDLYTTTPATINCKKSILCVSATEGKSPILNGDSAYIRYSAYADGTDFVAEWNESHKYIGFATGQSAPTAKEGYKWSLFTQGYALTENDKTEIAEDVLHAATESGAFKATEFADDAEVTEILETIYGDNPDDIPEDELIKESDFATDKEVENMLNRVFG
jgi:hypothetical protein